MSKDRDPLQLLAANDHHRLPELLPIRYGRMLHSPFTFYRGAAAVMAADLAQTPNSGIRVQLCGDAHLGNFRGLATPERNVNFDINDFDETLPGPWEWDIKRLAASFVVAMRVNGLSETLAHEAAQRSARSYRKAMRELAAMHPLDIWYLQFGVDDFLDQIRDRDLREKARRTVEKIAAKRGSDMVFPKVTHVVAGQVAIRDQPPLIYHPERTRGADHQAIVERVIGAYRDTLPEERRTLFDRYRFADAALKVVGVGSVGTRCWIALFMSESNQPLFLQLKQASASVLEPYAGASAYAHAGQRVVVGTRLMQASSDIFLGWTTDPEGEFYVRQLRDAKIKPLVEEFDAPMFSVYAKTCGWNLARAHARSGDARVIAGAIEAQRDFDDSIAGFAKAYADQTERDHAALEVAVKQGRVVSGA